MIIRKTLPTEPIKNFWKWLSYIKQSVTNIQLQPQEIERPLTIDRIHLQRVIDAKAARN